MMWDNVFVILYFFALIKYFSIKHLKAMQLSL